jgi:AcrR family transcriptional regulator
VRPPLPPAATSATRESGERARQQRERILRAAKRCFVDHGFHAASMADIAKTADMSVGLIYRYFDSKNDIVRAIIERQMEEARTLLDAIDSSADLVAALVEHFERCVRPQDEDMNAALFLEMAAEASRDPLIAELTRAADREVRSRLEEALRRSIAANGREVDAATLGRRALMLQCMIEGMLMRSVRQPDLDRTMLRGCLEKALAGLTS